MKYQERQTKAMTTVANLFLDEMKNKFPNKTYEEYKNSLLNIVNKEIMPICKEIMKKNEEKLKNKLKEIEEKKISEEEKQFLFNTEINSFLNIFAKTKMLAKAKIVEKNAINYIKFNEGQFSKKKNKREKEEKIFKNIKEKYSI